MGRADKNSLLAGIRGTVGPVTVTKDDTVKIRPDKYAGEVSDGAAAQQSKLNVVCRFFHGLDKDFFKIGFLHKTGDKRLPWGICKSYHMKNAVTGNYPHLKIDYSRVIFSSSRKPIENGWNAELAVTGTKGPLIRWKVNPFPGKTTFPDDEAVIVYYNQQTKGFRYRTGTARSKGAYTLQLTQKDRSSDIHCWMFFVSKDKKLVSDTLYLGVVPWSSLNM